MTDLKLLAEPFDPSEVKWRVGSYSERTKKCTLLAYIDARAVMDRLDEVVGPANWGDTYAPHPLGGLMCTLSVRCGDQWVAKTDGAEATAIEAVKGGTSDALKRAAVKWGVFRYGYRLPSDWHKVQDGWANGKGVDISHNKKHVGWVATPKLPGFALPKKKRLAVVPKVEAAQATLIKGAEVGVFYETQDLARMAGTQEDLLALWVEVSAEMKPALKDFFREQKERIGND